MAQDYTKMPDDNTDEKAGKMPQGDDKKVERDERMKNEKYEERTDDDAAM